MLDSKANIYKDIVNRTGGDIYIGVVGPVRTGKSTFIKKFMETMVIPNIDSDYMRDRAVDELPQSAAGKTIMTTEPKFIPEEAVAIKLEGNVELNVRLIDCVGYIVPSSLGYIENNTPRMIMTPWFDEEIPFNMAAEIGTQKVITEHSTVGIVVTTDGSISDIPRDEYEEAEQRVVSELKELKKPFVILLNSTSPKSARVVGLSEKLSQKYGVRVIALNCLEISEGDICDIIQNILYQFPVSEISFRLPQWITSLKKSHWLKAEIIDSIKKVSTNLSAINEVEQNIQSLSSSEYITNVHSKSINLGAGSVCIDVGIVDGLFYKILSQQTNLSISDDAQLMDLLVELSKIKEEHMKFKNALDEVEATGYGIVMPTQAELTLDEPEIVKQAGKYGVRLRANAPSIHMMKCNISTEVQPVVGSESQSEDLIMYLLKEFEENPQKLWESNIFGKSLHSLVSEGLHNKLYKMPTDARIKLQETIERMLNEGCNGLICLIL